MSPLQLAAMALRYVFAWGYGHLTAFMSGLAMLGLVLAVALLVTVLAVMNGFDREMRDRILALVPHITVFTDAEVQGAAPMVDSLRKHPDVIGAEPFVQFNGLLAHGAEVAGATVLGLETGHLDHWLSRLPAADRNPVPARGSFLLGEALARRLSIEPGDRLQLVIPGEAGLRGGAARARVVRVAGILRTGTELDEQLVLGALADVSRLRGGAESRPDGYRVQLRDLFDAERIAWELQLSLPAKPYVIHWMMTHGNLYRAIQLSRQLITLLLLSIIGVAAFNVVSSLVLVVTDKAGDIAILRTLGARRRHIAAIFLCQGGLIGVIGTTAGAVLGIGLSLVLPGIVGAIEALLGERLLATDVYPISFVPVDPRVGDIVAVGTATFFMCLLAAAYPAWRAANVAPARALQAG